MPFLRIKRLIFALAAVALLSGALVPPTRASAVSATVSATMAGENCMAIKMHMPCPASKSGPCKSAASDCVKMMTCCASLPGAEVPFVIWSAPLRYAAAAYHETPATLRGRAAEPALFPPKAS